MHPSSADRIVDAATHVLAHGDRAGAEGLLTQALRLEPSHVKAQAAMARLRGQTLLGPGAALGPVAPRPEPPAPTPATPAEGPRARGGPSAATPRLDPGTIDLEAVRAASAHWRSTLAITPASEAPAEGSLVVLTGPRRGHEVALAKGRTVLGRGAGGLDLSFDRCVAPNHAAFVERDGELFVVDGGSPSGTWVTFDGATRLAAGDSFSVGQQRLRYLGPLDAATPGQPVELGGPVPAASWRLEHTLEGNRPGHVWVLRGIVTLGRGSPLPGFGSDHALASEHVELRPCGAELELVDRSEGLGTWLCLPSGGERRLTPGTLVRLGSTVLLPSPGPG